MPSDKPHYYGGQALIEGVMMRGRETWAVAVRRPSKDIWVETHAVKSPAARYAIFRKPLFRGVAAMAEALGIGFRAMMIAANQSQEEEEKLTKKQMGFTIAFAVAAFIGIFIVLPRVIVWLLDKEQADSGLVTNLKDGAIRLAIFVGYLLAISTMKEIRRVFQYHGAEHKTIAAYEANEPVLDQESVDKYSTIHVRCGTNFLIMVMLLTIVFYSLFGNPPLWLALIERILGLFVIAGIAYEGLRLGAAHLDNPFVRVLMTPGLWLQKITTKQPEPGMIEVAIRSFEAVLPEGERARVAPLPSPVVTGDSLNEPGDVVDPDALPGGQAADDDR
ncbi:MAG TPA: DUF1385 domain-containing protein [Actinomycetota bacterium]|nr:DUF1385 domain-containing protein [Actinomycetota bacterium]